MLIRFLAGIAIFLATAPACLAVDINRDDVAAFIDAMVSEHDYDRAELERILSAAETSQSILEKISKPAEKVLSWAQYRPIFLTRERIQAGAEFWRENSAMLQKISEDTGVPIEIMVGIIGVETYFGRITGGNRVIDALTTLAFDYPPREKFFRSELVQFLLLVREEKMHATDPIGSYAGAMGRPQFMPSSYRAYAVDSTGDGKRDIWNDWADVAGSIANYFVAHGWSAGKEVVAQATLSSRFSGPPPENQLKTNATVRSLSEAGVMFATGLPNDSRGRLLTLDGSDGNEYWVAFQNFFVITRYNRSVMYALAVYQLGQAIAVEVARDVS
ncbi:MAG: lytic murein transglycosylase B [Gammaproteobacteria bacterium]|nr:lytic murein transglycosylase B [Gammaproteobacteria bacterium]